MTPDQQRELLSAAFAVACHPSEGAYAKTSSIQHGIARPRLRRLLGVLDDIGLNDEAAHMVHKRVVAYDRAEGPPLTD